MVGTPVVASAGLASEESMGTTLVVVPNVIPSALDPRDKRLPSASALEPLDKRFAPGDVGEIVLLVVAPMLVP